MKNLIVILVLAAVGLGVAGYYLEWYSIDDLPGFGAKKRYEVEVDTNKIRQDLEKGKDKVGDAIDSVRKDEKGNVIVNSTSEK